MKVLMVGGGTGGHIYPAIAIAQAVQEKVIDSQILFVGSEGGIETDIVPRERFSLVTIKARGMLRKFTYRSFSAPFMAIGGIFQSISIIKSFKPDIIVATGGFVSFPVIIAGFMLRVPVILHECNTIPGLTTRICKWLASRITVAFEVTRKHIKWRKVYYVGNPVRKDVVKAVKSISIQNMGLRQEQKIILVLGGSQGAISINKTIVESMNELEALNVQVIHVSGERDHEWIKNEIKEGKLFYHLIPYMYNIWDGLAGADLVISRAGALAISEITARGLPSILIPYPYSAEGHQDKNAKILEDAGAAVIIKDKELNKAKLIGEVKRILNDKQLYSNMQNASRNLGKPDAAFEFVSIITGLLGIDLYARKRKTKKPAA